MNIFPYFKITNYTTIVIGILLICVLQSFAFAQTDNTLYSKSIGWLYRPIILFILVYLCLFKNKYFKLTSQTLLLGFSIISEWLLEFIHSYGKMNLFSLLGTFVLLMYCSFNDEIKAKCFRAFHGVIVAMSAFGILISILYLTRILGPFSMVEYYDSEPGLNDLYANYILGYIYIHSLGFMRLCGLFNEPGLFGTIGALTLIADEMRFHWKNVVIIIACILSFSIAFLILFVGYFVFKYFSKWDVKHLCFFIILAGIIGIIAVRSENEYISFFVQRMSFVDGEMKANKRESVDLDHIWTIVSKDSEKLCFGYGEPLPPDMISSSSYKILIIRHGIMGCLLIFVPLFFSISYFKKFNKSVFILLLLFLVSVYQRPLIFYLIYFVILVGGSDNIRERENILVEQL